MLVNSTYICQIYILHNLHQYPDILIEKIAVLKKTFEDCEGMYEVYKDIADTYYSIAEGDYVSKLVKEQKKRANKNINKL